MNARKAAAGAKVASARLVSIGRGERPERACAVLEVELSDGRHFSVLTATPAWFEAEFARLGLPYYYGASVLLLERMDPALARKAAAAMCADGARWLCVYDTPRATLPQTLERFRAAQH